MRFFLFASTISYAVAFSFGLKWFSKGNQPARKPSVVGAPSPDNDLGPVIAVYEKLFKTYELAKRPSRIVPRVHKFVDLRSTRSISIDPTVYQAVDLDQPVNNAMRDVSKVTMFSASEKGKGPVVVVRGVGGGKTRAMSALHDKLSQQPGVLPILVTFNSLWPATDMQTYGSNPDSVIALAVIARMASVTYDINLDYIATMLKSSDAMILREVPGKLSMAAFAVFLAQQSASSKVVILIDETVKAAEKLKTLFPNSNPDAAEVIRHAFLSVDLRRYKVSTALVLSGLDPSISGATDSDKVIYPFELTEVLDATLVVDQLFLMDADEDDSVHSIAPMLDGSDALARQALTLLAEVFCHLPRGLEYVQDQLRMRVDRSAPGARKLQLSSAVLRDVVTGALDEFKVHYPGVYGSGLPPPDLLFSLLFQVRTPFDQRVTQGIRGSTFVNSLTRSDFAAPDRPPPAIQLRSSLVSLFATLPKAPTVRQSLSTARPHGSVEDCVEKLLRGICGWSEHIQSIAMLGTTLEMVSLDWLRLLLTVAARAKRPITLRRTLQLNSLDLSTHGAVDQLVREYLFDAITLPEEEELISLCSLRETCYGPYDPSTQRPMPSAAALVELDNIRLSEEDPVRLLKAAPGDCWNIGIADLGSAKLGERAVRVVLFDNKTAQVLKEGMGTASDTPSDTSTDSEIDTGTDTGTSAVTDTDTDVGAGRKLKSWHKEVNHVKLAAELLKGKELGPIGSCFRDGKYLYISMSTHPGHSTAAGNVVFMRNRDTEPFFNFMYPAYRALKAATESAIDHRKKQAK
jgi:hypothetical protein